MVIPQRCSALFYESPVPLHLGGAPNVAAPCLATNDRRTLRPPGHLLEVIEALHCPPNPDEDQAEEKSQVNHADRCDDPGRDIRVAIRAKVGLRLEILI